MRRNSRNSLSSLGSSLQPSSVTLVEVPDTGDCVILTVPRSGSALPAMRVVAGWMATCSDLPLDQLDDLNLAIETLLVGEPEAGGALTLRFYVRSGMAHVEVQGLESQSLRANLLAGQVFKPSVEWPLDVRVFLAALVDEYDVGESCAGTFKVSLRKRIQ